MDIEAHLELIVGTMFSGKSTELIKRIKRYEIAGLKAKLFKPIIDNRYSSSHVASHDQLQKKAILVGNVQEMVEYISPNTKVIGIDEVQFLDSEIINFCDQQANEGRIIVTAGLLKDFLDRYFSFSDQLGNMGHLLEKADQVTYLKAICTAQNKNNNNICGKDATRVQRFIDGEVAPLDSPLVQVGGTEAYAPRCREHFQFYQ